MPTTPKKTPEFGKLDIEKNFEKRLYFYLDLRNINGMSPEMASALVENGIKNVTYIPSNDPLAMYDDLLLKVKNPTLAKKWVGKEYRRLVMNGLMLAAMKYISMDPIDMAKVDALCPAGHWVNEQNGITRLTAFVMVSLGLYNVSDLKDHTALEYYQDAVKHWVFSKLEGLEFYESIKNAKMILDSGYSENESGPSNPTGP